MLWCQQVVSPPPVQTAPPVQITPPVQTTPPVQPTPPQQTTPPVQTAPPAQTPPVQTSRPAATDAPFVRFQAVFQSIPDGFLTLDQVSSVASSLSTAISSWVLPNSVTINITQILPSASSAASSAAAAVAAASPGRRSLLQSTQTFQATLTFTLTFISPQSQIVSPAARATRDTDLSAAIAQAVAPLTVDTTLTPVTSGTNYALNVSVTFPPGNTVSATPAQGTLAAVALANALEADAGQALPGLVAKDGPVSASGTSLQVVLVPAGAASTTRVVSPPRAGFPSAANISTSLGGKGECCAGLGSGSGELRSALLGWGQGVPV